MVGVGAYRIAEHPQPSREVVGNTVLSQSLSGDGVLVHQVLSEEVPLVGVEVGHATASMPTVQDLEDNTRGLDGGSVSLSISEGIGKGHLGHVGY